MKKSFMFYILFCLSFFLYSNSPSIQVNLQTDKNIQCSEWNNISAIKNNSIVVSENGIETDKFTTKNGEIIEILSVSGDEVKIRTSINKAFTPGPSAPYWSSNIIIFSYNNKKLSEIICYPEKQGSQSGPNIELLNVEFGNNKGIFSYSYQQYGDAKYAGYGTINFEIQKLKYGYFYVSEYECNVNGYFRLVDPDEDLWLPSENGEMIVTRDISKNDFFNLFTVYKSVFIYDTAIVDKICLVYENLRLRENENTSSKIVKTMKSGEYVKILQVGKKETIDEIPGNWCYVEIVEPKNQGDITKEIKSTGVKGWCFSGYLK